MTQDVTDKGFNSQPSSMQVSGFASADDVLAKAYDYYDSRRFKDAIHVIEQSHATSATSKAQVVLGNAYFEVGDSVSAVKHWQKAIEISPLEHLAYVNLGNYLYSQGKIHEAIHNWVTATTIVPENPKLNLNLALAYDKINSRIKATKYFEKYLMYETNTNTTDYIQVKSKLSNLMAKVEFYMRKLHEYKAQKDIKAVAALYLKIISTYALMPASYSNIADIFEFDKNYEKALEFYQVVYLYFPFTNKVLIEIANLCYILKYYSYAYVYYSRFLKTVPEGSSYFNKVSAIIESLETIKDDAELIQSHLEKAKEAAERCDYETAIDEYENYMILTSSESDDLQQKIDRYKIFVNPEPFVINILYNQLQELLISKKFNTCIEFCDRILAMAKGHTKEVVAAMKYKSDCKRILATREA